MDRFLKYSMGAIVFLGTNGREVPSSIAQEAISKAPGQLATKRDTKVSGKLLRSNANL